MTWSLRTGLDVEAVHVHGVALAAAGLLGSDERDGAVTLYFPQLVDGLPVPGEWALVEERDWLAVWKEGLAPVRVCGLTITPPWIDAGPGAIVIDPGQAFGTGHHETTTGCLAALAELDLTGRAVLDVGTGTGVLAVSAARLGAASVVAVDVDPLAVSAARESARVNGVRVDVRAGSTDVVSERFDVVVANLDTSTLCALARDLVARMTPGGTLIASGVSVQRQAEALRAFATAGLPVIARPGREWVALLGRSPTG